jgi:hypothetical protein
VCGSALTGVLDGRAVKKLSKRGAGDGTRTRDNLLGRQGLCQLSYSRRILSILARKKGPVKVVLYAMQFCAISNKQ